ncbi:MAG: hypothetical protein ACKO3Q_07610, partial [Betaproteobacteria bacterium]
MGAIVHAPGPVDAAHDRGAAAGRKHRPTRESSVGRHTRPSLMLQTATRPDKILILDDDARIRDLLRRYLSQEGFEVT